MAKEIQAFRAYSPRIRHGKMNETLEVAEYIAGRSSLTVGDVYGVLLNLKDAFSEFSRAGKAFRLEGVGIFSPTMDKEGNINIKFRLDKGVQSELNKSGHFQGTVVNADMKGKSAKEMIERWNREHPDDPIEKK